MKLKPIIAYIISVCSVYGYNYSGQTLKDINFYGKDLSYSDFSNSLIEESVEFTGITSLDYSDFTSAKFYSRIPSSLSGGNTGRVLRGVKFINTKFYKYQDLHIDCDGVDFNGADFSNATKNGVSSLFFGGNDFVKLNNVSFENVNFSNSGLTFYNCSLTNCSFNNANISGARIDLYKTSFTGKDIIVQSKNYKNKDLNSITFQGGILNGTDFSGFNLKNITLLNSQIKNSNFDGADLSSAVFCDDYYNDGNDFTGSSFVGADFTNANISLSNFSYTNLKDAILSGANLGGVDFTGANIRGADLTSTVSNGFTEAQLKQTMSFQMGDLRRVMFDYNNISKWDLSGQKLQHASFFATRITNVNFTGADLRGAEMSATAGSPIYKNTIMVDGTIKNFSMISEEDTLKIHKYKPLDEGGIMISAKVSEADASISGGAKLTLEQGAFFEVANGKTLTVASDGLIQIDTDLSGSTIFNVNSSSGLVFEDGAVLTVNIIDDIITSDAYTFAVISFEDDSRIAGLNNFVKDETLFLTVNGKKFNGAWNYAVKGNDLSISINVPEPATYAAIFGALALAFAAYRRRK